MRLLHVTHPSGFDHDTGLYHPERPARLRAALQGVLNAGVEVEALTARAADPQELALVHRRSYVEAIERLCRSGGGNLDPDTRVSEGSWAAALASAGAGLAAVEAMANGFDGPAVVTTRPPGHHALPDRAMGFCVFNNVAIAAARLREEGNRVAIIDWDVHHGNGTQVVFYDDPQVLYVSLHQAPFYPYQGLVGETGTGEGAGTTLNIPLPAFTGGDVYREAFTRLVVPSVRGFSPDWVLVSSGFDAHAHDPLAEMRLVESDYAFLARGVTEFVPPGRVVVFLEGGYHLPAIRDSLTAVVESLVGKATGSATSEHPSSAEAWRHLERLEASLRGQVVGVD